MASIYKRGKKWRGQIMVNGKRYSYTADKKSDVIQWAASVQTKNIDPETIDYTVKEWMEIYLEEWYRPRVKEQTYINNANLIHNHLYPVLGDVLLKDLSTPMIQEAYSKMFEAKNNKGCKYSDGTIKLFAIRFNKGLSIAVEEGLIRKNPHSRVVVPKYGVVKQVEAFTADEQSKIIAYTKYKTDIDGVYYMLIATGIRVGECIALTWDDVNFEESYININKTAVDMWGHMTIQDHPKTAQSVRKVYFGTNIYNFLIMCKEHRCNKQTDLVFLNKHGNMHHTSALRSRWIKICAELEIPYKNLHALRHSWATRALEKKIEINTVSKMLGHKSVATTMDIYQSVFTEQRKKAAEIMNDIV